MSTIEWTDETWNVTTGCTRVSAGCTNCYAVPMTKRLAHIETTKDKYSGLVNDGKDHFNGRVKLHPRELEKPLHWRKPRRVFVNSMSDLFHPGVPNAYIDRVFAVMALAKQHKFQVLTKRPRRMAKYLKSDYISRRIGGSVLRIKSGKSIGLDCWDDFDYLNNVWLGTSVENQQAADQRIPYLLQCPARVRFLSCEPLIGPIDLSRYVARNRYYMTRCEHCGWVGSSEYLDTINYWDDEDILCPACNTSIAGNDGPAIHWVIAGGESGHNARPMHPDWVGTLRDQCTEADVPFFFKQWGAWKNGSDKDAQQSRTVLNTSVEYGIGEINVNELPKIRADKWNKANPVRMSKVGKTKAGRQLDGRQWNQFPDA